MDSKDTYWQIAIGTTEATDSGFISNSLSAINRKIEQAHASVAGPLSC